jgi:hypothetical protein
MRVVVGMTIRIALILRTAVIGDDRVLRGIASDRGGGRNGGEGDAGGRGLPFVLILGIPGCGESDGGGSRQSERDNISVHDVLSLFLRGKKLPRQSRACHGRKSVRMNWFIHRRIACMRLSPPLPQRLTTAARSRAARSPPIGPILPIPAWWCRRAASSRRTACYNVAIQRGPGCVGGHLGGIA